MQPETTIKKISFIGSGNVAWGLAPFFQKNGIQIVEVYSTNKETSKEFSKEFNCNLALSLKSMDKSSDLFIIAVPDREIKKLMLSFPDVDAIVAHTSGIIPMSALSKFKKYGVFYPLQTFTRGLSVDMSKVPFCIEGSDFEVENELLGLAMRLSRNVNSISSVQRKNLHLAAVLVSNFPNLLYNYANEIADKNGLDYQLLIPLMEESVRKVKFIKPENAQTGPARRNDRAVIEEHLKMLKDYPEIKELYNSLSEKILKRYYE